MVKVTQLTKLYGQQRALNGISFSVGSSEIIGFLGPNGAGKSTTMKIITGFLEADGGTVEVCGIPVSTESLEAKKKIGYLPEANPLYMDMYVREFLAFIAGVHNLGNSAKKRIEEVLNLTGLLPESRKKLGQLSKGYKQRAGLAAALLHDPEVLILDEPTSGLDPNQIIEIRELIKSLAKNKTVLFSSHILQEVEAMCSRVVIINKGNIVADAPLSELKKGLHSTEIVKVEFSDAPDAESLQTLSLVRDMKKINEKKFELYTTDAKGLSKELMSFALHNNMNIVSLQSENSSLEEIFHNLTLDVRP